MAGEIAGAGDGLSEKLKSLKLDEMLEVLSQPGFCKQCLNIMEDRVRDKLSKRDRNEDNRSECSSSELCFEDLSNASSTADSSSAPRGIAPLNANHKPESPAASIPNAAIVDLVLNDGLSGVSSAVKNGLTEEEKERIRFSQVGRKKDFVHIERVDGKPTNVLQGLELHTRVFNAEEQKKIVECVYQFQRLGQRGELRERTYSEPRKWMRGKGRVTIQFGCCYNYAADRKGNPPGILRDEEVDPLPPLFKKMIKRLVRWHVLPPSCIPNSCIVNIYDEGDCIPPHIDHHDFLRPFCTVSLLTESNILFGLSLKPEKPGEFTGPVSIPLPLGSVLVLKGNGADVAKHCVPAVPAKRISITFRKMDESKIPYNFSPELELIGIKPLIFSAASKPASQVNHNHKPLGYSMVAKTETRQNQHRNGTLKHIGYETPQRKSSTDFLMGTDDFPPLGGLSSSGKQRRGNKAMPKH